MIITEVAGFVKGCLTMVKFYGIMIKEVHRTHVQRERSGQGRPELVSRGQVIRVVDCLYCEAQAEC